MLDRETQRILSSAKAGARRWERETVGMFLLAGALAGALVSFAPFTGGAGLHWEAMRLWVESQALYVPTFGGLGLLNVWVLGAPTRATLRDMERGYGGRV